MLIEIDDDYIRWAAKAGGFDRRNDTKITDYVNGILELHRERWWHYEVPPLPPRQPPAEPA
jgi:hypothetical protein